MGRQGRDMFHNEAVFKAMLCWGQLRSLAAVAWLCSVGF